MRAIDQAWHVLKSLALVLSVIGAVTFSCFIFEEALQLNTFGCWAYSDAGDWEGYANCIKAYQGVRIAGSIFTKVIGWVNPVAMPGYLFFFDRAAVANEQGMISLLCLNIHNNNELCPARDEELELRPGAISPADIEKDPASYEGKEVTVQLKVRQVIQKEKVSLLSSGGFSLVIFPAKKHLFPDLASFKGKTLLAKGKVKLYKGQPEIILEDPSQITIIEEQ